MSSAILRTASSTSCRSLNVLVRPGRLGAVGRSAAVTVAAAPAPTPDANPAFADVVSTTGTRTVRGRSTRLLGYSVASGSGTIQLQDGASARAVSNKTVSTITVASGENVTLPTPPYFVNGLHIVQTGDALVNWSVE